MLGRSLILKTSSWKPVERLVRKSFLFRPLVRRFIAGDSLDEALVACKAQNEKGMFVSLDYLGENTASEAEAMAARAEYVRMLDAIGAAAFAKPVDGPIEACNISIKLTQCGLDQGDAFAESNYRAVVERAADSGNFVRVDMEASAYTERTIDIVTRVLADHANTGTVLQSYLKRNDADVDRMIELGARVRLVKGAYLEPADVAYTEKAKVDEQYVSQAKRMLEHGNYPAFATHDAKIIAALRAHAEEKGIEKSRFEFQMLYGIRRDLQESLRSAGYHVRVYIPFGDAWYPYFSRRLAERPANMFFILKSMFRG